MSFYPFVPHEISVLIELILGHLRYLLTDVPPQPNSPPDYVLNLILGQQGRGENLSNAGRPVKDDPHQTGWIPRAYLFWLQKEAPPFDGQAAPT
jgi:hypothetical protein